MDLTFVSRYAPRRRPQRAIAIVIARAIAAALEARAITERDADRLLKFWAVHR